MPMISWSTANLVPFEELENWSSDPTHALANEQDNLVHRIRRQLATLSKIERIKLIYFIDGMLDEQFSQEKAFDQLMEKVDSEKSHRTQELEACYSLNIPAYMELPKHYDTPNLSPSKKATWSQIYSILSLHALGETIDEIEYQNSRADLKPNSEKSYMEILGATEYLFEAFELVSIAEQNSHLGSLEKISVERVVKNHISEKARDSANARYLESRIIKDRFINYYKKNEEKQLFKGKADAARQFYKALTPQEQKAISKQDYEQQIVDRTNLGLPSAEVFPRAERVLKAHLKSYEESRISTSRN